jgi:translocation and assembly module TamB
VASPALSGEIGVTGGRFAHEGLPQPIEDFSLALRFAGADADFDGALRTRAGTGNIDGKFRWAGEDWSARLRLHAQELLLEPRRGTRIHVVPDITVELDPALASISGEVRIPKADIDLEALPETAVSVSRDTVMVGQQKAAPGIDYALSVKLSLGKQVHLRGFGADARLGGELRLLRNPDAPIEGRGEVRILEGRYTAYGQRLEVSEGSSLVFNGPLTRPALRINAVRHIEDEPVEVGVQVRGDAKAPELKVFSRPTMPESRALHYLLTGRAPTSGTDNELAVGSAMMQLGISGAGKVTSKIFGKLGIQDFQVDSRKVQGGTEVQLSGYLTPDLYLRYGVSTFEKVNTFRLRYRLTPRFFVEAVSGVENAVDFLYSFSR